MGFRHRDGMFLRILGILFFAVPGASCRSQAPLGPEGAAPRDEERRHDPPGRNDEAWGKVVNGLRMRIWTDRESYPEGDAIWQHVEFENTGKDPQGIVVSPVQHQLAENAPLYDLKRIKISGEDHILPAARSMDLVPVPSNRFSIGPRFVKLLPGQRYQEKSDLSSTFWTDGEVPDVSRGYAPFEPRPGVYTLQAEYEQAWAGDRLKRLSPNEQAFAAKLACPIWSGTLTSNTVKIRVTASR